MTRSASGFRQCFGDDPLPAGAGLAAEIAADGGRVGGIYFVLTKP